jgi:hypothetical protein
MLPTGSYNHLGHVGEDAPLGIFVSISMAAKKEYIAMEMPRQAVGTAKPKTQLTLV